MEIEPHSRLVNENMQKIRREYLDNLIQGLQILQRYNPMPNVLTGEEAEQNMSTVYLLVVRDIPVAMVSEEDRATLRTFEWWWREDLDGWIY